MDSQVFYQVPEEDEPRIAIVNPIKSETTKNYGSINIEMSSMLPQIKKSHNFDYVFTDKSQKISETLNQICFNSYTPKLISIMISISAISVVDTEEYSATFCAINLASILFAILSIFALSFWKDHKEIHTQESTNNALKFTTLHKISWNEIDETMSFILAMGHLSCIIFMKTCETSLLFLFLVSLTNSAIFGINWYKNLKPFTTTNLRLNDEITPEFRQMATKNFYKGLKDFSLILNFVRFSFFIAAFYACVILDVEPIIYFVYCTGACVGGTMVLIGMEISEKIDSRFISTFFPSNHYTFVSLFVTIHASLIVLSNSLLYELHVFGRYRRDSFSDVCPLSYAISCIVFIFSIMDLYSQALFPRTQAQSIPTNVETALNIETGAIKKHLPMTIENPFIIENEKKQIVY